MKMLLILGGLIGALLLAPTALAADGGPCQSHTADAAIPLWSGGFWTPLACVQLCDAKAVADDDGTCTEFDFETAPGLAEVIVFEYEEDPDNLDCSATPTFTMTTGPITGGAPAYSFDSTAVVLNPTDNRISVDVGPAMLSRFLFVDITGFDACSDVDVRMFFYGSKTGLF
jgi:hypothetical protein